MESPYKFEDESNPRIVTNLSRDYNKIYAATGLLFAWSVSLYHRRYMRHNLSAVHAMFYIPLYASGSYGIANTLLSSSTIEAAEINNDAELAMA